MHRLVLDEYLAWELNGLQEQGLLRDPADAEARERLELAAAEGGASLVDACSNDYLNLARGLDVSRETVRAGAGAARLVQGSWPEHRQLERELADWVGLDDALLFASGYAANLGAISALGGADHAILSDELNHASIIDGCRLSRARVAVIPHLDLGALETALAQSAAATARWVVSESYFSMDGDGPDLRALRALCDRHRAFLVVDEAHALGVFGAGGSGRCAAVGVKPDVLTGTLGKAVGTQGAFVAGSEHLRTFLWNRARSFVFSTGTSPALAVTTLGHLEQARGADAARANLLERTQQLRALLLEAGMSLVPNSFGPIVCVIAGRSEAALRLAQRLRDERILAQAIRPPTVRPGQARVRFTVTAAMTSADVARIAAAATAAFESKS